MGVTNEEIIATYRETRSVWKTGKALGISGQSVHDRLVVLGLPRTGNGKRWDADEEAELIALANAGVTAGEIARRLGRTFASVTVRLSRHGVRIAPSPKDPKIPRGAGYDKASIGKHLTNLERGGQRVTKYARAHGLTVDSLVRAAQMHYPGRWERLAERLAITDDVKPCPYCQRSFHPQSGKQRFCTRQCAERARRDETYFSGNMRNAIGWATQTCQLCGRSNIKGLTAHHVIGKENDPDDEVLITLCRGCHKLVGLAAGRSFVERSAAWETLIVLAVVRRREGKGSEKEIEVSVRIEVDGELLDDI